MTKSELEIILIIILAVSYMFPTIVAMLRRNKNTLSIAVLNFFLAWTILGWILALVWAFKKNK